MKFIGLVGNYVDLNEQIGVNDERVIVFDIDNTLYKETPELVAERRKAGFEILKEDLNITFEEYDRLSDVYTKDFGSNYKGFILNHKLRPATITKINEVYADLCPYLPRNNNLIKLIKQLPFKTYCFTNSNLGQAKSTLNNIGLLDHIDYTFYVKYDPDKDILCKPLLRAYETVNEVINTSGKHKVLFFDDNEKNIAQANTFGWIGIHVVNYDDVCEAIKAAVKNHYNYVIDK